MKHCNIDRPASRRKRLPSLFLAPSLLLAHPPGRQGTHPARGRDVQPRLIRPKERHFRKEFAGASPQGLSDRWSFEAALQERACGLILQSYIIMKHCNIDSLPSADLPCSKRNIRPKKGGKRLPSLFLARSGYEKTNLTLAVPQLRLWAKV